MKKEPGIIREIASKDSDKKAIASKVIRKGKIPSEIFEGVYMQRPCIKYGCEKVLRFISEQNPRLLYPKFDFFVHMLDHDNKFITYGALVTIANLTAVDSRGKFEKVFDRYYSHVHGSFIIPAATVIRESPKVIAAKPALATRIVEILLGVEKTKYKTTECRDIAIGHAIHAFDECFDTLKDNAVVIRFVRKQLKNRRNATRKKAERFLKKHKQN